MSAGDHDALIAEAAAWVARMDAGGWSDADESALQAWLALDHRHPGALLEAEATWLALDPQIHADMAPASDTPASTMRVWIGGLGALAASIALIVFLWMGSYTDYSTGIGEIRRVALEDGSIVSINSGSEVEVAYGEKRRDVRLREGEAWFEVAKNPDRPFVVDTGHVTVTAVGTAFSVRRKKDGAEIIVTEGVVVARRRGADRSELRILAGQHGYVGNDGEMYLIASTPAEAMRALAWRDGMIHIAGNTLDQSVEQFNRYNPRRLVIADPVLADEQLDGIFRINDPEGFATAIGAAFDVPVDTSDPDEIRIGE